MRTYHFSKYNRRTKERSIRGQVCLRKLFQQCVKEEAAAGRATATPLRTSVVEWHHCNMEKLHEEFHGEDHPHRHVFQPLETLADIADDGRFAGEKEEEKQEPDGSGSRRMRLLVSPPSQSQQPPESHPKLALWVGPPALDGVWKEPRAGSSVDLRFAAVHSNLRRWDKKLEDPRCKITHYQQLK